MAERLAGKTALITGAAHGQGRSHAVRLASEGADVIALDACAGTEEGVAYPLGTWEELQETVALVEQQGRRGFAAKADVRDRDGLRDVLDATAADFPNLEILVANAAVASYGKLLEIEAAAWQRIIDVNLTGVFNVVQTFVPRMIESGGGSVIIIGSVAGLKGLPFCGAYAASKHGLQGLMKVMGQELGEQKIRVNTVNPGPVNTAMAMDTTGPALLSGDGPEATLFMSSFLPTLPLPESGFMDASDISDTVAWLASDESRFVTGAALPVDAGVMVK
jgi:(+)-trans-carveol dehydrogenase